MSEYIEREKAIVFAHNALWGHPQECEKLEEVLRMMPSDDVAPVVHGTPMLRCRPERYERYEEYGLNENGEMLYLKRVMVDEESYAMYCPACGKRLCSRFTSFCPNCGAKMDGEE